jgi:hypothetical protein
LGGGPPGFMRASTRLALLEEFSRREDRFHLRDYHPLWSNFPEGSVTVFLCNSLEDPQSSTRPSQPPLHNACGLACSRFGLLRFRSPLLTQSMLSFYSCGYLDVSVPHVRSSCLWIQHEVTGHDPRRVSALGHSGVLAWLAARPDFSQLPHVRLRLLAPNHPPHTLCSLTTFAWSPSTKGARLHTVEISLLRGVITSTPPKDPRPTSPFVKELAVLRFRRSPSS